MELCERIKTARKEKAKITQKELAKKINKSVSAIQKYEMGLATPPIDVLEDISRALDVPVGELLGLDYIGGNMWGKEADDKTVIQLGKNIEHWNEIKGRTHGDPAKDMNLQLFAADEPNTETDPECTDPLERIKAAWEKLNPKGREIAAQRLEELTKIKDYQA